MTDVSMTNIVPFRSRTAPQPQLEPEPQPRPQPRPRPRPEPLWREAIGEQLRAERTERGERIADIAARAGVAPQYLSELERGRKDPSSEVLSAVSGALGLSVLQLTRRAGDRLSAAAARGPVCLAA
jgi:ribosome-binding protein aMBF1 (putative translation factor)